MSQRQTFAQLENVASQTHAKLKHYDLDELCSTHDTSKLIKLSNKLKHIYKKSRRIQKESCSAPFNSFTPLSLSDFAFCLQFNSIRCHIIEFSSIFH